jgi:membrane associated rhomboid family serine protease
MIIIIIIIAINVLMSLAAFQSPQLMDRWIMRPYAVKHGKQWYRFITSGFIHANWPHLLINMYVLYTFGGIVYNYYEYYFGLKAILYFPLLYLGGLILSDLPTYSKHQDDPGYMSLGASGAVSSLVFASILLAPTSRMGLLFIPIMIPAYIFGVLYLAYSHYMSEKGGDNINHSAHFTGALFGVAYTLLLHPAFGKDFINQIIGNQ